MLLAGAEVLILDEPTSVLTPQEVDGLFDVVRRLRAEGTGIVIITHKMREVREIADRVTVLRGGKVVLDDVPRPTSLGDDDLVNAMVGESVRPVHNDRAPSTDASAAQRWSSRIVAPRPGSGEGSGPAGRRPRRRGRGDRSGWPAWPATASASWPTCWPAPRPATVGEIVIDGADLSKAGPTAAFREAGVVSVAADPLREFVVPGLTRRRARRPVGGDRLRSTRLRFDVEGRRQAASGPSGETAGAARSPRSGRRLDLLSGGNIQRVLLTLAFGRRRPGPGGLLPDPRAGRARTTETTRSLLLAARDAGAAVILISEDLDELLALSDRIAVLAHGRCSRDRRPGQAADRRGLGQLMTGSCVDDHRTSRRGHRTDPGGTRALTGDPRRRRGPLHGSTSGGSVAVRRDLRRCAGRSSGWSCW